jgi:(+)-neomenthol dehydrogenase
VLREFLKDYKEGALETNSGYTMAKTALNSYTRLLLALKFPHFRVNSLCPGFVKTAMNEYTCFLSIDEEGAECPVKLA